MEQVALTLTEGRRSAGELDYCQGGGVDEGHTPALVYVDPLASDVQDNNDAVASFIV
jgi:hypothetical protein